MAVEKLEVYGVNMRKTAEGTASITRHGIDGQEAPEAKPIMEINPDHPLIRQLTSEHDKLEDWSMVLFDQAALSEGAKLSQPAAYVQRVNDLLTRASLLTG